MENAAALALALLLDLAWGEPPRRLHPVVWLGWLISQEEKLGLRLCSAERLRWGRQGQLVFGSLMALLDIALFALPAYWLLHYLKTATPIGFLVASGLLLKLSFSVRGLRQAALKIRGLLRSQRLVEARGEMRALVSRDTSRLDRPLLASATVESVAENTCDSLVAPLFYFALFGVPGALAYRAANTLDAMIGYHGKYEYLGKFAARLDDVLNYLPARLTGLLLVLAAFLARRGRAAWHTMVREHGRTESPNAGWPMSAMAGALRVRLEKVGHYRLGEAHPLPELRHIDESVGLMMMAVSILLFILFLVEIGVYFA